MSILKEAPTACPLCHQLELEVVTGDKPCKKCQSDMEKGFLLIGVDFSISDSPEMAIRTGHRWIIKPEAGKLLFSPKSFEKGAGLIDILEAKQLGLGVEVSPMKADLTLCGICNKPIHRDELGGIDKEHGFMHKTCMPLKLI